jgi:ankyrin repeat protein
MLKIFIMFLLAMNLCANNDWNALHEAVFQGNIQKAKSTLQQHDINSVNGAGLSALHIAVKKRDTKMLQWLLHQGANIDAQDKRGFTALYYSVLQNQLPLAKILLNNGADINLKNHIGNAPIHNIAHNNRHEMLDLFLEFDADLNLKNPHGMSAYDFAQNQGHTGMMMRLKQLQQLKN